MRSDPLANSYYAATAQAWETQASLASAEDCDVAIIGGGFSGLSAALACAEKGLSVILLEANSIGFGASGRNGGQLIPGLRWSMREIDAEFGRAHGLKPRARIKATAKIGTDPTIMLTGPVPATQKILADSGMNISDIDLFEVNEAFASVVLRFQQAFDVDPALVNACGGAIAMGHPLGATGCIIIGTLLDELERTGKGTGLATLCIASGMGVATIIERV
jgi:acetyl-CoA acetyltransferase